MRVLIVIAHEDPSGTSTSHRIAKASQESLISHGHEVRIVDLLQDGFNKIPSTKPVAFGEVDVEHDIEPEVLKHQKDVEWCTHYILIGPMWNYTLPSIYYAYYERVFRIGWACDMDSFNEKGLLKGRKAMLIITCGGGLDEYNIHGEIGTVEALMAPITLGKLRYVGFKVLRTQAFYNCLPLEDEDEKMKKWKEIVANIDSRPELPIHPAEKGGLNNLQRIAALEEIWL